MFPWQKQWGFYTNWKQISIHLPVSIFADGKAWATASGRDYTYIVQGIYV